MDYQHRAADLFDRYAEKYQEKFMDVSLYHEALDIFCDHIPQKNADILEVACGPGNITKYILEKRPDFRLLGTDLAENMMALAQQNNPGAEFRLMDARHIGTLTGKYNGMICGFILPYLSPEETTQLIRDAATLLRPGGILYLSTMEDDESRSGTVTSSTGDQVYMYYYRAETIIQVLSEYRFTVVDLQRKQYQDTAGNVVTDMIVIAQKQIS